ncbi:MAG: hypothetical protein WC010_04305 [Candidatus Absconditabacterales bacterium]
MKKHFLIVILFTVMFLGLGNITLGYSEGCTTETSSVGSRQQQYNSCMQNCAEDHAQGIDLDTTCSDMCSNEQDNLTANQDTLAACQSAAAGASPTAGGTEAGGTEAGGTEAGGTEAGAGGTEAGAGGTEVGAASCSPPINGKMNSFNICSCPTGTKNVKGTCELCSKKGVCCGVELNTNVPFIGKCIESDTANKSSDETNVTGESAFPVLLGSLTKILVTIILIVSFVLIIIGGIMISTGDPAGGKKMIIKVVIGIALLGASGVILRLINPNFFG